jgi:hypothetical protein
MNPDILAYLPVIAPVATLVVVVLGVMAQNRHVDARIGDVSKLITAESARLEAVLKLEIAGVSGRVKTLEERGGTVIYK